jgi:hypothetical protein
MIPDELVERVARAIFDARHKNLRDCWSWDDYWGDDQEPDRKFYYRDARAAIAIALEEAARVAELAPYNRGGMVCGCSEGLSNWTAAAIRAMIKD